MSYIDSFVLHYMYCTMYVTPHVWEIEYCLIDLFVGQVLSSLTVGQQQQPEGQSKASQGTDIMHQPGVAFIPASEQKPADDQ